MADNSSLLIITNLYPVPWAPNRASFNRQQFELIAQKMPVNIIVLLGWLEWLKHRKACKEDRNVRYCPYFYLPKIGRRFVPFFQYLSLLFFIPWIKRQSPSTLLAAWVFPDAVAVSMLNQHLKLPLLVKAHGTDINENAQFSARVELMRRWLSRSKMIFCASKDLMNKLIKMGISKAQVQVNYNGVNTEIFYPENKKIVNIGQNADAEKSSTKSKMTLIFVGSIIKTKGIVELVEALPLVKEKYEAIELIVLGEGNLTTSLKEKALQLGISENLCFKGSLPLNEVASYMRQADLLVLPSYREGVPNVLLESFACGTPVVATRVGGIPEIVTDDVGILVEEKQSKALSDAILKALSTPWSQEKILDHAKNFNWQHNVDNVLRHIN